MDFTMFDPHAPSYMCTCHVSVSVHVVPEDSSLCRFSGSIHHEDHQPLTLADKQALGILLPQPLICWGDREACALKPSNKVLATN